MPWLLETVRCRCGKLHLICSLAENAPANGDLYEYSCPTSDDPSRVAATSVIYLQKLPADAVGARRLVLPANE